jgi:hypothetical protein
MNTSSHFRYYLALVLLVLLGLAIRVQNGADVTAAPSETTAAADNPPLVLAKTR